VSLRDVTFAYVRGGSAAGSSAGGRPVGGDSQSVPGRLCASAVDAPVPDELTAARSAHSLRGSPGHLAGCRVCSRRRSSGVARTSPSSSAWLRPAETPWTWIVGRDLRQGGRPSSGHSRAGRHQIPDRETRADSALDEDLRNLGTCPPSPRPWCPSSVASACPSNHDGVVGRDAESREVCIDAPPNFTGRSSTRESGFRRRPMDRFCPRKKKHRPGRADERAWSVRTRTPTVTSARWPERGALRWVWGTWTSLRGSARALAAVLLSIRRKLLLADARAVSCV